jgi:hypothetical protein
MTALGPRSGQGATGGYPPCRFCGAAEPDVIELAPGPDGVWAPVTTGTTIEKESAS